MATWEKETGAFEISLTEVEVETQKMAQQQQWGDAQHDRHKGQYKETGWSGLYGC